MSDADEALISQQRDSLFPDLGERYGAGIHRLDCLPGFVQKRPGFSRWRAFEEQAALPT